MLWAGGLISIFMKTYTKTHKEKKAFDNHLTLLKSRGANIETKGLTIKYFFDDAKDVYGDKLNTWHDISFEKGDFGEGAKRPRLAA